MATLSKTKMTNKPEAQETRGEQRAHVQAILGKIKDVLFVTYGGIGSPPAIHARPLHVSRLDDDGTLWFMVGLDSKKAAEVRACKQCYVSAVDDSRWLQLDGTATLVTDRATVEAIFQKFHEAWFPDGPRDPNVGLIKFTPSSAEYWDNSGLPGMKYLFEVAKALVTGEEAGPVEGVHGKLEI